MHNNNLMPYSPQQQQSQYNQQLLNLFTYYCGFADRQNYQYMKIQNFRRMLLDAQLIDTDNCEQMRQVQILFSQAKNQNVSHHSSNSNGNIDESKNKNKNSLKNNNRSISSNSNSNSNRSSTSWISFDTFVSILPKIEQITNNNEEQPYKNVLQHLQSLYNYILENTQFGSTIKSLSPLNFSQPCFLLLQSLSPTLFLIYCNYFNMLSIKSITTLSDIFASLTTFTKQFELVPQIMAKSESYLTVKYILELNDLAESAYKPWFMDDGGEKNKHGFKYFDFVVFVLFVSFRANRKINGFEMASQFERLVVFLEMMEVSSGFGKMCKKQQINLHLIPNQKLVKQLSSHNSQNQQLSFAAFEPEKVSKSRLSLKGKPQSSAFVLHPKLIEYYADLHQQFLAFCLHGESIGTSFLSHKKCIDVVKKLELGLKQSEIEVYLASYSKVGLDFQNFLHFLQKINQKQISDIQEIIEKIMRIRVLDEDLSQKLRNSRKSLAKMTRKQYRNCVAIIELIQPILSSLFIEQSLPQSEPQHSSSSLSSSPHNRMSSNQYIAPTSNPITFISLSSYLKIMHNLELSPLYLSKQALIDIFGFSIKKSYSYMAFAQFKDSFIIALPYFNVTGNDQRVSGMGAESLGCVDEIDVETKMVVIVERIGESRGVNRIAKSGKNKQVRECLSKVRHIFAQYYPKQMLTNSSNLNNSNPSSHRISQHSFS